MEQLYSAIASNRFAKILLVCCLSVFTLSNVAFSQCDNVTNGGSIGGNQTGCVGFNPTEIYNNTSPSGGSGALEIIWMYWNASTGWSMTQISGATGYTYDPGPIYENTYFRRCARRAGCSSYNGESNDVFMEVTTCNTCDNVTSGGSICCDQSGCIGFDPANIASSSAASGGSGTLEYMWLYRNASTGWSLVEISGANGASYNPGPVYENTYIRRCARRSGCSTWVGESNEVLMTVTNCNTCDNVTNGGGICCDQSGCPGFDPSAIYSSWAASGGSGNLEYMWLYRNASTGWALVEYAGANGESFDPGPVYENTYIRRCARRSGCTSWVGESNEVFMSISECCNNAITSLIINDLNGSNDITLYNGAVFNTSQLPSSWNVEALISGGESVQFNWSGNYNNSHVENQTPYRSPGDNVALNFGAGTYTIYAVLFSQDNASGSSCDNETITFTINACSNVTNPGSIGVSQSGCAPYDPYNFVSLAGASGGNGTLEYVWIYRNASSNNQWVTIANSNSASYDAPAVWETTEFRRCARRSGCTDWIGESNIISVVITNNCNPTEECTILNWSSGDPRIFWIPDFGTDFASTSSDPLKFRKFANGHAQIVGTIQRNSNANEKFFVNFWFDTKSTFMQWIAMGMAPHNPDQGDETTWTYYKWSTSIPSYMIGLGALAGENLTVFNSTGGSQYGLQYGNGAGSIMPTNNGISTWFSYSGTTAGNGDINGLYNCPPVCDNVTNGGTIGINQANCGAFNPNNIQSLTLPTGGSGTIEYMWLYRSASTNNQWIAVNGANASTYDPGQITETTCFRRCARRANCTEWVGESNDVCMTVYPPITNLHDMDPTPASCNACDGANWFFWNGGTAPYTVTVDGATPGNWSGVWWNVNIWQADVYGLCAGNHTFLVTDANGCSASMNFTIIETVCTASLGDFVWYDTDRDGVQDPSETGVSGVTVSLYTCAGAYVGQTTTNGNGFYQFTNLTPNQEYYVVFSNLPASYVFSPANNGNDATDSDANAGGQTACVHLSPNENDTTLDAGINLPTASLGDFVWYDSDRDGVQDPGETGVSGVTVSLYTCAGAYVGQTTTNGTGFYQFTGLEPNQDYYVVFSGLPADYVYSPANNGNDATDSDANAAGQTACVYLSPGENDTTLDAGINLPTASLGDFVWYDSDRDGVQDPGETGVSGVTVSLYTCAGAYVGQTTTNGTGFYQFTGLEPNQDYYVVFSGLPADYVYSPANNGNDATDSDANAAGQTVCVYLSPGENDTTLDAGINLPTASLGDFVWYDSDRDGVQDPGETGVSGVTVSLYTCAGAYVGQTTTNGTGFYQFTGLEPNQDYYVVFSGLPADYVYSPANNGNDATDSDANAAGQTACVYLSPGENDTTLDAGINLPTASLGDFVWYDSDRDGVQDPSETGVSGVTVSLYTCAGAYVGQTTTNGTGFYQFTGLEPNQDYYVVFSGLPADYVYSPANNGNDATDSDANAAGQTACVYLSPGENDTTLDAGINLPTAALGDYVWIDANYNGQQDDGATGVQGITVTLFFGNGNPTGLTTVTDANGFYLFPNLEPNQSYYVVFGNLPANYVFTGSNIGNDASDSDANNSGQSQTVTLAPGETNLTVDAGIYACPTPSVVSEQPDTTVACIDDVPTVIAPVFFDPSDSNLTVSFNETSTGTDCNKVITRVWTATNDCGNSMTANQVINVIDNVDPELHGVPANMTLECGQPVPNAVVNATDNCTSSNEMLVDMTAETEELACGSIFTRTWSVTDACGNTTTATQVITIVDTTNPYITNAPQNISVECSDEIPAYVPVWADNCDANLTLTSSSSSAADDCYEVITETYTATDDCGNSSTVTRVINIIDTTAPSLSGVPADATVECSNIPAPAQPTASDLCDENVAIVYNQEIVPGDACSYTIVRTWTATDDCGNQDEQSQVLTVVDTTNPTLIGVPADATVECSNIPAAAIVTYDDNCADDLVVGYNEQFVPNNSCTYTLVRTWTVVDHCGNTATDSQVLTVVDTTNPTLIGVPANITVECDAIPAAATVTGDDNCDDNVTVTMEEVISTGCPYTVTRTWTGVDECGNDVSATQVISVIDTTFPVLHSVPANMTLECGQPVPNAVVWATDNCTEDMMVDMTATTEELACGSIFTRTWSVTDACGNTTAASQVITIVDTTNPYITNAPQNISVECSDEIPAYVPVWADNCDANLTLTSSSSSAADDCYEVITETYTATDDCGNSSSVTRVINIIDTTAPSLSGVPADATVECSNIPAPAQPTASDLCDENVAIVYNQEIVPGDACSYTIVRTWTATDDCGNQDEQSQVLTVVDTTNPTLIGVPADATVECSNIPAAAIVTYGDNCADDLVVGYNEQFVPNNSCTYTLVRTWTVVDHCGNTATDSQVLTVVDTTNPTLIGVPANVTVECDAIPAAATVTGDDNCDDNVTVTMEEVISTGCPYTVTRTWTGVDECGNDVSATQVISVIDTTNPVLYGVPADLTIECDQPVPNAVVTATDNCTENMTVEMTAETDELACGSIFTRTWSVTDACGNTTTATQVITIVDTTNPYITNAPQNISVECSDEIPAYVPVWADNCDANLTLTSSSSSAADDCYEVITETYTATDDCGNSSSVTRVINIIDTTAPSLSGVPADATVECSNIPAPAQPSASDLCDENVAIVYNQEIVPGDACSYTIVRTWTATDDCGNQDEQSQVLTVVDTTNPTLIGVPADATVECSNIPAAAIVTYGDNCADDLVVGYNEQFVPNNSCTYTLVRTWTVVDHCGNTATDSQVLTVVDTTNPTLIGVPANVTVECDAIPAAATVTGDDNCDDNVTVTMEEVISTGCPYTVTRTWTGVDECGNDVSATQVISVIDTTNPVLYGVPADLTIECDQPVPNAVVTATDNCTENMTVEMTAETEELACGSIFTRMWSVTDACGNTTTAVQVITIVDTTNPYITNAPQNISVECSDEIPAYVPVWADNCDANLTLTSSSSSAADDCYEVITETYTATDDCGNSSSVTRVINIIDTTAPSLSGVPADATVECSNIPAPAQPTASDLCDENVAIVYNQEIVPGDACLYTIVRTWTATDDCGNQDEQSQVLTVVDTTNPTLIGVPADATVECSNIPAAAIVTYGDNCADDLVVGYNEQFVPNNSCTYTLVRTWTVVDHCGNTATDSQVLTVVDTTNPTLIGVPANVTVECDAIPAAATVTGDDNCDDNVTVTMEEVISTGCPYTVTRTWTGVDECGNDVSATQVISVIDTTNPVLYGVPADLTIECDQPVPNAVVTATDNCTENMTVEMTAETEELACGSIFTRTWSVTDACGNTTTAIQVITIVDTTNPYITNAPQNISVECSDEIPAYVPVWADNCDANLTLTSSSSSAADDCYEVITETYTATDDCGNSSSVTRVINIIDTTAPSLSGVPADATVECSNIPAPAQPSASDLCDENVAIVYNQEIVAGDACSYTIVRTWTATDDCGNQDEQSQVLTVVDTTNPTLIGVPADATVECSNIPAAAIVTYDDNCADDLVVGYNEQFVPNNSCTYTLVRTWTVVDHCGNTATDSQVLTVVDTTAPELSGEDFESTFECNVMPNIIAPTATDNCDTDVEIIPGFEMIPGDCPNAWTEIHTWTAIDECGNTDVRTITLHFEDTTAPVLSSTPANLTFECTTIPAAAVLTASDNCDDNVTVDFTEETVELACGFEVVRTWFAIDDCGNYTTHTQTITAIDTTNPTLDSVIPAELTVECGDEIPSFSPIFSDNCDDNVTVLATSGINNLSDCGYDIERVWSASDDCGNAITVTQVVHVVDTTSPALVGVPANVTVECNQIPTAPFVSATDACDQTPNVSFNQTMTEGCPYTITRTWTATDACGNTSTLSQVINVIDTTVPVLSGVPADATVECSDIPVAAEVVAQDICSGSLSVEYVEEVIEGDGCTYTIERTWSATDACGNETTSTQVLTVVDTTNPWLNNVPANTTVECDEIPAAADVTGSDLCDSNVEVSFNETMTQGCPYVITRVWTATDNCGNITTGTQMITVIDTTAPVLSANPVDETFECGDVIPAPAVITAQDNCFAVDVDYVENMIPQECGYIIERIWTATDLCDNATSHTQLVYVLDETSPVIVGVPNDITIECDDEIPAPIQLFATDNCDDIIAVQTEDLILDQECYYQIKRFYYATDACGNMTTIPQIITIVDVTAPTMAQPQDITVSCDQIPAPLEMTANDNCDQNVEVTFNEVMTAGCPYTITRTWTAFDECGNAFSVDQVISVYDASAPSFLPYEGYVQMECDEVGSYLLPAEDNCDSDVTVVVSSEFQVSGECYGQLLRTYVATDNCGNTAEAFQIIDLIDTTAPVIEGVPADVTIACGSELPAMPSVVATDNCTENVILTFEVIQTNQFCPYDLIRKWIATDLCGNVTIEQQVIHVTVDVPAVASLQAYPNPTSGDFTVKFSVPNNQTVKAAIYDVTGKMVAPLMDGVADGGRLYEWPINGDQMEAGSYVIMVNTGTSVEHKKLVINK